MVQGGGRPRLLLEAPQPLRIRRVGRRQHLHGDVALEPFVPCAVNLAHPAGADRRDDLVRAELRPALQSHWAPPTRNNVDSAPVDAIRIGAVCGDVAIPQTMPLTPDVSAGEGPLQGCLLAGGQVECRRIAAPAPSVERASGGRRGVRPASQSRHGHRSDRDRDRDSVPRPRSSRRRTRPPGLARDETLPVAGDRSLPDNPPATTGPMRSASKDPAHSRVEDSSPSRAVARNASGHPPASRRARGFSPPAGDLPRLAGPRRIDDDLAVGLARSERMPERSSRLAENSNPSGPFSHPDRGRAVEGAHVRGIARPAPFPGLREQDEPSVL